MAFFDLATQLSNAQALTTTAVSTNVFDVTGAGSGTVPNGVFGTTGIAGVDIGTGDGVARPTLFLVVGTTFVGGTNLTVQLQAAPDAGGGTPGTYTTIYQSGPLLTATLVSGATLVAPVPPTTPGEALPRFYRINYLIVGTFSAGTVTADILINAPSGLKNTLYPSNFTAV